MALLKTQLQAGSIVYVGMTDNPRFPYQHRSNPCAYELKIWQPYARVTGAQMRVRPPIELLATMGIKVIHHGEPPAYYNESSRRNHIRYTVVGCRYSEYAPDQLIPRGIVAHPMVIEHLRTSKKIVNEDVEVFMPLFDEPILRIPDLRSGVFESDPIPEEEGWIAI